MRFIIIETPNGVRKVQEGEPFRLAPNERVIGAEGTQDSKYIRENSRTWVLDKLASYFSIPAAELIFFAAKAFGIPHCAVCEMRYKILKEVEKIGLFKSIKLIAKTVIGYELDDKEVELVERSFQEDQSST